MEGLMNDARSSGWQKSKMAGIDRQNVDEPVAPEMHRQRRAVYAVSLYLHCGLVVLFRIVLAAKKLLFYRNNNLSVHCFH